MTPDAILALYDWEIGACFRCSAADAFVTRIDEIVTPRGERYELSACGICVLGMEEERRHHAERKGFPYVAGELGRR
ncbi:hypothetical protein ACGFMM_01215 [Streptomyces sp. NPDC048604]|uniref:hypothetical protein n=1 Tax=Streptomyces sp. NPDC048604 TaxID=3365578 RepID=UPI0037209F5C